MGEEEKSIPLNLLFEAIGQNVSIELKNGDKYRGNLVSVEKTMSLHLKSITLTMKNGQSKKLEQIYLRGSQIKYFVLPDILEGSPVFKKVTTAKRKFDKKASENLHAQKKQRTNKKNT